MAEKAKPRRRKRTTKPDNPAQSKRFIEAARMLGVVEKGGEFDDLLDKLLKPKKAK